MKTITATKFMRGNTKAAYDEVCTHSPVLITSDDRPDIVMVLANDYGDLVAELDKFKWISVDASMPDDNQEVISVDKLGRRYLSTFYNSENRGNRPYFKCIGLVWEHDNVTHWMPLPSAPTNN